MRSAWARARRAYRRDQRLGPLPKRSRSIEDTSHFPGKEAEIFCAHTLCPGHSPLPLSLPKCTGFPTPHQRRSPWAILGGGNRTYTQGMSHYQVHPPSMRPSSSTAASGMGCPYCMDAAWTRA